MAYTGMLRLSQSPSLLISGSGSWPQRDALALSLAFAAENIKSLPLALCARENFEFRLVGKSRGFSARKGCLFQSSRVEIWVDTVCRKDQQG